MTEHASCCGDHALSPQVSPPPHPGHDHHAPHSHAHHQHEHAPQSACSHDHASHADHAAHKHATHAHVSANEQAHSHSHQHGHACSHDHAGRVSEKAVVPADAKRLRLHILAMDCPTEEALIRKSLSALPNVLGLDFDLLNRILTVHHHQQDPAEVHTRLHALGMSGKELDAGSQPDSAPVSNRGLYWRLAIGGIAAFASESLAWFSTDTALPVMALAVFSILICGLPTLKKGWIALRHLTLNIHLLMTAAVIGALAIGQWPEAAMVICLFAVAEMIEAASLIRARDAISGLLAQAPETAQVEQTDGSWLAQPTSEIAVGALVQCRPGDRIALDGVIESGKSSINQAAITGESMPVEKQVGDTVYAGSLNQSGAIRIRVTAAASASMLARIAHSVQEAQSQRAPTQGFVDRFAAIYTPVVFVLAILLAVLPPLLLAHGWHDSLYRALVLLVIACPCALVISTPVTVVSGLALAARKGIVVKGGAFLEQGKEIKHLALDKTGTLTEGTPALQQIFSTSTLSQNTLLHMAASLDAHSTHPLAQALVSACQEPLSEAQHVGLLEQGRGRGIQGEIAGKHYQLGNHPMLAALQIAMSDDDAKALEQQTQQLEQQGHTVIFLCSDQRLLGLFAIADQVRASSKPAISALHALGISTTMLTGDNRHTAQAIAKQVGISDVRAELLPEDKLAIIRELADQGITGMTGDGINDAPALARAHIGFAMAAGSDTALETADVALMQNDLRKLPEFIHISRQTSAVLKQNIAFALSVKFIFFALALTGHASLWMAVFADTGTSLLVVLNGLRLLNYAPPLDSAD